MPGPTGAALRAGYRCDCDGVERTLRVCSGADDPSEQILTGIERATGERPDGCPWRAFDDPYVGEVLRAYRWWKAGQLALRWPDPPVALLIGLEVYDAALNAVQAHDSREERKRRETEAKERELSRRASRKGRGA